MTFRKQYTNLHTHTIGSMLDGQGKPKVYMEEAKRQGMTGLAVTDHGNLHLMLDWYEAGIEHGVKPIMGLEAYQARKTRFDKDPEERAGPASAEWAQRGPYHLTILAKNMAGYKNLIKLSSRSYLEGFYVKPRIDLELLDEHSEGLIVLSGCLNGQIQQALMLGNFDAALQHAATMQEIIGKENYFIEIQDHGIDEQKQVIPGLIEISKAIGAPIVPTGDCHYVHKSDAEAHDVMLCVATKATVDQENRFKFAGPEFYLKSYDEMAEIFEPEWLENSMNICDMIDVDLKFDELYFPEYLDLPPESTIDTHLEELVWAGAFDRYGERLPEEVTERINYELKVVKNMGFQEYFLVVQDLINWGKSQGIRFGPGRGSAAGSILSYCLKITDLDPIRFKLLFERFLVEGRKSPPDIDIDMDDRYREKMIQYVRDKYGADKVAHIATFASVKARSAIRDAARALGYEYIIGDTIAKMIPPPVLGKEFSIEKSMKMSKELADGYEKNPDTRRIIDAAKGLEGVYRQPGIHAAGIIISRGPITNYAPVMQKGEDAPVILQWGMDNAEKSGLLKIDFLALANLGTIDICIENIKQTRGEEIEVNDLFDFDDETTYRELRRGNAIGAFQIESGGMRDMMISVRPDNFDDIAALISLYRPGPMGSGMDKDFINRKHGREKVTYPHVNLEKALVDSHGVMLYQEDVLNVCKLLAGFSGGEADDLRKVIGKKKMDEVALYREKFVKGCVQHSQISETAANKIYSDIEYFAGYGFNRAHAFSYAVISYITAYLKFHYPAEYMAALMTTVASKKDKLALYLHECRKLGIIVSPPSIVRSENDFKVSGENEILFGLSAINGIGASIISSILESRTGEDNNLFEFFRNVDIAVLNKATLEHLSRAGAFDELVMQEATLMAEEKADILELERNELGIYVTDHPLLDVWSFLEKRVTCDINSLDSVTSGQMVTLGGILNKVTKRITKRGQRMFTLTFEDMTGDIEIVVFPKEAAKLPEEPFKEGDIGLISGQLIKETQEVMGTDEEHSVFRMFFNSLELLDAEVLRGTKPIVLKVDRDISASELKKISGIIDSKAGDSLVFLEVTKNGKTVVSKFKKRAHYDVKDSLEKIIAIGSVDF